PRSFLVRKR
nr:Chain C, PRO-ARG-SER-PHE-LEU-VAL-ARG-LYS-ARG [Homo sapiens]